MDQLTNPAGPHRGIRDHRPLRCSHCGNPDHNERWLFFGFKGSECDCEHCTARTTDKTPKKAPVAREHTFHDLWASTRCYNARVDWVACSEACAAKLRAR